MSTLIRYLVICVIALGFSTGARAENDLYKQLPDDIVLGKEEAPITIIEYASLSCPHCAHFHNTVLPTLKEKYIDTGKAKLIFRSFPLDLPALKGTVLAYCAGNDRFYNFLKVLFDTQESWAFHKNYLEMLANIGKLGGVKADQFDKCMADKDLENKILEVKLKGAKDLEVNATPTFFINGKKFDGGRTVEEFSKDLDAMLAGENQDKSNDAGAKAKEGSKEEKSAETPEKKS